MIDKLLPVKLSLLGTASAFVFYKYQNKLLFKLKISTIGKKLYNFLNKKWFFDKVYNEQIGQFFFNFGYTVSYKIIDRGIFEILGPHGISSTLSKVSFAVAKLQTGYIYHYTFLFLTGITVLLAVYQSVKTDFISLFVLFFIVINFLNKK